jgi:transcriptional regulator
MSNGKASRWTGGVTILTGLGHLPEYRASETEDTVVRLNLVKGTLDMMVLETLRRGPLHGYAIARRIKSGTENVFQIDEGALYPALHRLEERGWVEADWGISENNRRARFYQLTPAGRKALASQTRTWQRYVGAVAKLMHLEPGDVS